MCPVSWCSFSWEAAATIFAALVAGTAATIIAVRQSKIIGHQTIIERIRLRSEIYERRWEVYSVTVEWLRNFWETGKNPTDEIRTNYIWAIEKAKFLFRPKVASKLESWLKIPIKMRLIEYKIDRVQNDQVKREELEAELAALWAKLDSAFGEIGELFAEEMRLSDFDQPLPPLAKPLRDDDSDGD